MSMPFQHIHQISEYLAGTDITLLELRGPKGAVRLANNAGKRVVRDDLVPEIIVTSPGTGLFLHRHPASETALIHDGDVVAAEQIVGLLRVGVLLMPVKAPSDGIFVGHLMAHGELVDFGKKLIALRAQTKEVQP